MKRLTEKQQQIINTMSKAQCTRILEGYGYICPVWQAHYSMQLDIRDCIIEGLIPESVLEEKL